MASQQQQTADLKAISVQINKIHAESSASLQKVTDLEKALADGGMTSPDVDQAIADLKQQVQLVDDLIADAPVDPPA